MPEQRTEVDLLGQPAAGHDGEYLVVARRYRPQTFADLIGQEHVVRALEGAIANQRVGHAYLFTGARGVGKTSAARIFAKALNCVAGPTATPCNRCDVCLSVSTGEDVDVLEIDGASNRRIDEMRELRQNVRVRPSRARFKIYIIDEVHMLTNEAFNALLKTLEEPPEHVKFIFCTTEPEKIPITILSRCQRFDFAGIQTPAIVARLRQIAAAEQAAVEDEALEILARRAAGSMRDSQSLLEQLLSCGHERIAAADVHAMLGTAATERLGALVEQLVARRPAAALGELDRAVSAGVDLGQLLEQLVAYLRDVLVTCAGAGPDALLYTWGEEQARVRRMAERLGLQTTLAALQVLDHALDRLRYSTQRRTLAELALVRIATLEDWESLTETIGALRETTAGGPPPAAPASRPTAAPAGEASKKNGAGPIAEPPELGHPATGLSDAPAPPAVATPLTPQTVSTLWQQVLARVSQIVADQARKSEHVALAAPGRVVVSFRQGYTFAKSICERPDGAARLQQVFAELTGEPVRLEFALVDEPAGEAESVPRPSPSARQKLHEASEHPLVRRACDLFDAHPVRAQ
jgi:DNA polymerase-3 subunit gamma/tau